MIVPFFAVIVLLTYIVFGLNFTGYSGVDVLKPAKSETSIDSMKTKSLSRRTFVRNVLLTSLAVPTLPLLSSGNTRLNGRLKVAVLGARSRGMGLAVLSIDHPDTELGVIVEVDDEVAKSSLKKIEQRIGRGCKHVKDYREVLDDKTIDIVAVATPNHSHALTTLAAMQAGKDVFLEKPASHTFLEGRWMLDAARKFNRICQVGTQARSCDGVQEGIRLVQDGGIGDVRLVHAVSYRKRNSIGPKGDFPIPSSVDFNLWNACAPFSEPRLTRKFFHYDWHWQRLYGGGEMTNNGPHQMDVARWGLQLGRHPQTILTYGTNIGFDEAGDTLRSGVTILDYGDKTVVFEIRNLETPMPYPSSHCAAFYGTEGSLVQSSADMFCVLYDPEGKKIKEFQGEDFVGYGKFNQGEKHFDNFVKAVKSRRYEDLNTDILDGHRSVGMCHLGNISWYLGENNRVTVKEVDETLQKMPGHDDHRKRLQSFLDYLTGNGASLSGECLSLGPVLTFEDKSERFVDNKEADILLSREYRKEFPVGPV